MPKKITLKFGKQENTFEFPENADSLSIREPEFSIDIDQFESEFSHNLPAAIGPDSRICIVVADKTRLCGYETYLPVLVNSLQFKGVEKDKINFFIAYGTHAPQEEKESFAAYGDLYKTHNFIHHDCNEQNLFAELGTTTRGTTIRVRKEIIDADLVITFGALSHHYFAGYGGGRKLLFPGLACKQDIYKNHSLFLNKKAKQLSTGCQPGNLENNPLAEDLKEIDSFITSPRISIHGILNSKGKVCELIIGKNYNDFLKACTRLDSFYKAQTSKQYQLVIASCGGFPKDINIIQAHKAINNAAMFVKDGGTLVVLAQCIDGLGSKTFLPYFEHKGFESAFDTLEKDYQGNGGTALSMMTKTRRIKIFLKTDLDDNICSTIGVTRLDDDKIKALINKHQDDMTCVENASLVIK